MDYVQEHVATLHGLTGHVPDAPCSDAAIVVPMTAREEGRPAAEHTLETLASVGPRRVVVPVRAPPERIGAMCDWLEGFAVPTQVLWCNGPAVEELLAPVDPATSSVVGAGAGGSAAGRSDAVASDAGVSDAVASDALPGDAAGAGDAAAAGAADAEPAPPRGKGTDVWLGLGVAAADAPYVVVHDADATTYDAGHVPRLLAPLTGEFDFTKGYYARVEDDGIYGRLFRLFYEPLLEALEGQRGRQDDRSVVEYLAAFRYALAGEFGLTADLARSIRAQRAWGLEVGTLGEAFRHAGRDGAAQVDLGVHRHDHRRVDGDGGLATMSRQVGDALFRVLADEGLQPEYESLRPAYRDAAFDLIEQYAADARFNGLPFDRQSEREQVAAYVDAIAPPGPDTRLPAWRDAPFTPAAVVDASERALAGAPGASTS